MSPDDLRRTEFAALDDGSVFLNAASVGPMPARSIAALAACNRDRARPGLWPVERLNTILGESRWMAGRLINADESDIALMPNTTTGLNVAAHALPLVAGDIVLTFDREFPSNVYPWMRLSDRGVTLERIPVESNGWPDEAGMHERLRDERVRAVSVSLTQFSNGYTVDLEALSHATRALGKFLVVDAIQAIGQIPVDVQATPVDFLACGAQKWLLGPWGTGFLYVRRELATTLMPGYVGWAAFMGSDDYSSLTSYDPRPLPDARRFEVLTFPVQDFAAMNASLGLILGLGIEQIAAHTHALHRPILDWAARAGARITSPQGRHSSAILCFVPPGDPAAAFETLRRSGIQCSLREGAVRLSPHLYNGMGDMERTVEVLGTLG